MKNLQSFDEFVNEGRKFSDFNSDLIVKKFVKDYPNKNSTSQDLDQWIDDFAYEKKIEYGIKKWQVEELVYMLNDKGYNKIEVDAIRSE